MQFWTSFLILFFSFKLESMDNQMLKQIATCPSSPNCVSSLEVSPKHKIKPWSLRGDSALVRKQLRELVLKMPRVKLIKKTENYDHFVFTSKVFRFKDDVWLYFDPDTKSIHFKSASRIGYSDFGVNRKRVEGIKQLLKGIDEL